MKQKANETSYGEAMAGKSVFRIVHLQNLSSNTTDFLPAHPQQSDCYQILLVAGSNGRCRIDFREYPCTRGTVLTLGPQEVRQFGPLPEGEAWLVLFPGHFIGAKPESAMAQQRQILFDEIIRQPVFQLEADAFEDIRQTLLQLNGDYRSSYDPYQEGILKNGLQALLLKLERCKLQACGPSAEGPLCDDFLRFRNLVETHCFATRQVSDYAAMLGYSAMKLNYVTRAMVGRSAKDCITDIFMLRAKRLLAGSTWSTKDLARHCGFDEATNFLKFFRKYAGLLPSAFRRQYL